MNVNHPTKLKLTNGVVDELRALGPDQRSRRYWDTEVRGLYLQFSKAGTPSYMLRYTRLDGRDGDISLGQADLVPLALARSSARDKLANLAALKIDPMEVRKRQREEAKNPPLETFADVAEAFLAKMKRQRSKERQVAETRHLRVYVLPEIGAISVKKLTKQHIVDLVYGIKSGVVTRKRRKGANGKTTANLCHNTIKRILRWAVDSELCTRNVADFKVMFPNKPPKRVGRLDEQRFAEFWNAATAKVKRDFGGRLNGFLAQLLYMATLQRPIDIGRARREHFDLQAKLWTIPPSYHKTGETTGQPYFIPLTDLTIMLVKRAMRQRPGEYLFPSKKTDTGFLDESAISQNWRRQRDGLFKKGAITEFDIELYDCRRFGRTQVRHKLKFDLEVAEAMINHEVSNGMERRYDVADLLPKVREAQEAWSAEIIEMTGFDLKSFDDE